MASNTFGHIFRLTTFGESHGQAIGGIIDGCPAGLEIDEAFIQKELDRRKPGQSLLTSQRHEDDKIEFLSGIFKGQSTGAPIAFMIRNKDQKPQDYSETAGLYRPSHADFTWEQKYGIRDYRGGGRSSARETANWVVGGAVAKLLLKKENISIAAFVDQIGPILIEKDYRDLDLTITESSPVRCPDHDISLKMEEFIRELKEKGDTAGGAIRCIISGVPVGLGEPVFSKLHAELGKAMLSINAVKGFEYGSGFKAASMKGSEHNDIFKNKNGKIVTETNCSGGIQGGISNGQDIYFRVAFKPVATLMKEQETVDSEGKPVTFTGKGRHDVCVVPRAVPIVEATAAMVIVDHFLKAKISRI
jgi:chorismate synthase